MIDRARSLLARLVETHYEDLRVFVRRRVGSATVAQDIVQETWLRVATDPPARDPEQPLAYLYRVAANLALDRQRRERLEARHHAPGPLPDRADAAPGPDRVAAAREELAVLQCAVTELPERCRAAFLLCRGRGLTMREAAARLGISEKTVEKHVARALVHCRRRLAEAGIRP